jgi:hypothetical protein
MIIDFIFILFLENQTSSLIQPLSDFQSHYVRLRFPKQQPPAREVEALF